MVAVTITSPARTADSAPAAMRTSILGWRAHTARVRATAADSFRSYSHSAVTDGNCSNSVNTCSLPIGPQPTQVNDLNPGRARWRAATAVTAAVRAALI